jgi:hypothetical protein
MDAILKSVETASTPDDPLETLVPEQTIHQNTNCVSLLIHGILLDPSCIPTSQLLLQSTVRIRPLCYWAFDSVDSEEITKDAYCCECSEDLVLVHDSNLLEERVEDIRRKEQSNHQSCERQGTTFLVHLPLRGPFHQQSALTGKGARNSRLHQSFYVLVDPTIRMVLGVGAIGRVIVGNRLLQVSTLSQLSHDFEYPFPSIYKHFAAR